MQYDTSLPFLPAPVLVFSLSLLTHCQYKQKQSEHEKATTKFHSAKEKYNQFSDRFEMLNQDVATVQQKQRQAETKVGQLNKQIQDVEKKLTDCTNEQRNTKSKIENIQNSSVITATQNYSLVFTLCKIIPKIPSPLSTQNYFCSFI
jgi:septal ring factor EnvC (AmiA/AmiB activator)